MEDTGTRGGKKRRIEEVLEKVTSTVEDASPYGVAVKITKKEVRHDEEAEEDESEDSEVDVLEYEKKNPEKNQRVRGGI